MRAAMPLLSCWGCFRCGESESEGRADGEVLIKATDPPSLIIHVRDNLYDSAKLRVA
jgi:hypothetical protein